MKTKKSSTILRADFIVSILILFSMHLTGPYQKAASMPLQIDSPLAYSVEIVEHTRNDQWELITLDYAIFEAEIMRGTLTVKRLNFNDGARYSHFFFTPKNQGKQAVLTLRVPLQDEAYEQLPLSDPSGAMFYTAPKESLFVSAVQVYDASRTTFFIKKETDLKATVKNQLRIDLPMNTMDVSECWYISSSKPLVDFTNQQEMTLLKRMDFGHTRQWSLLGNLYPVSASYSGAGEGHFWNNYAYHVGNKLLQEGSSAFSKYFSLVSAEHILNDYPESGHWLTPMKSLWLEADYQIAGPFYDTRFNTDAAQFLMNLYQVYHFEEALSAVSRHIDFFKGYCGANKIPIGDKTWGIADYSGFSREEWATHGSLNHWLAEICLLYDYYLVTQDTEALKLADDLIDGITAGGKGWKKMNGDLWYGYHEQDGFVIQDYIDVTYFDLLRTQKTYAKVHGTENPFLNWLILTKKRFIDQQPQ